MGTRLYINHSEEELCEIVGATKADYDALTKNEQDMDSDKFYDWLFSDENEKYRTLHNFNLYGFGKFDLSLVPADSMYGGSEFKVDKCLEIWSTASNQNPGNVDLDIIKEAIKEHGLCWG